MNRRPGHVDVTTEVGYCNFCQRPRNLRTQAHHLGTLVRTIVTCETCHRTLSSTMGVAAAPDAEPVAVEEPVEKEKETEPTRPGRAAASRAKPPATKAAAAKKKAPAAKRAAAATKAPAAKPRSTATRKSTRTR